MHRYKLFALICTLLLTAAAVPLIYGQGGKSKKSSASTAANDWTVLAAT